MSPNPKTQKKHRIGCRVFIPFNLGTHQKRILRVFVRLSRPVEVQRKNRPVKNACDFQEACVIQAGACPGPVDCSPLTVVAKDYKGAVELGKTVACWVITSWWFSKEILFDMS